MRGWKGWWFDWLADRLVGCLFDWQVGWLGWLVGWLGWLVGTADDALCLNLHLPPPPPPPRAQAPTPPVGG